MLLLSFIKKNNFLNKSNKIIKKWYNQKNVKQLSSTLKWLSGRAKKSKILIRTKTSLKFKNKKLLIYKNYNLTKLGVIATFKLLRNNAIITLLNFFDGSFCYFFTGKNFFLFNYFFINSCFKLKNYFLKNNFFFLWQLKRNIFISVLELKLNKGFQYSLSAGSKSKFLVINYNLGLILIELPSKRKKFFYPFSLVLLNELQPIFKKKCFNKKAGYWRNLGIKSMVRGVAKNPVDHPHGGRTKSIKYPRTPWGHTTKYK